MAISNGIFYLYDLRNYTSKGLRLKTGPGRMKITLFYTMYCNIGFSSKREYFSWQILPHDSVFLMAEGQQLRICVSTVIFKQKGTALNTLIPNSIMNNYPIYKSMLCRKQDDHRVWQIHLSLHLSMSPALLIPFDLQYLCSHVSTFIGRLGRRQMPGFRTFSVEMLASMPFYTAPSRLMASDIWKEMISSRTTYAWRLEMYDPR